MYLWESKLYNKMLNEIMLQFSSEVDLIDPEQTSDQRKERMDKLHESNMATTAYIDYGDYPWNPVSLRDIDLYAVPSLWSQAPYAGISWEYSRLKVSGPRDGCSEITLSSRSLPSDTTLP